MHNRSSLLRGFYYIVFIFLNKRLIQNCPSNALPTLMAYAQKLTQALVIIALGIAFILQTYTTKPTPNKSCILNFAIKSRLSNLLDVFEYSICFHDQWSSSA